MSDRKAICGPLSLVALCAGVIVGAGSTEAIASKTEGMASFGAIGGIAFGLLACIPSLVLAVIGLFRAEKPIWPAVLGLMVSFFPGLLGLYILEELLKLFLRGH